jgi:hypothetical protein
MKSGASLFPIGIGTWNITSRITDQQSKYRGVLPDRSNEAKAERSRSKTA